MTAPPFLMRRSTPHSPIKHNRQLLVASHSKRSLLSAWQNSINKNVSVTMTKIRFYFLRHEE